MKKTDLPPRIKEPFEFLSLMSTPRPFHWFSFVEKRRMWYGLASLMLLIIFIILPLITSLKAIHEDSTINRLRPNQIALYFGALVVVAFVRYSYVLYKLWDDSKSLVRYGMLDEANLLWVIASQNRLIVTYRFWTIEGREIVKDTVIDGDGPYPLASLLAGDVVPVLYDSRSPRRRSMLWAEIERYMTPSDSATQLAQPLAESAI